MTVGEKTSVVDDTERSFILEETAAPARLDRILADAWPDLSRTRLQALVRDGFASIDGLVCRDPSAKPQAGSRLALVVPAPTPAVPAPERIPLDIVFEDRDLIVLNKPAGLVVHPGAGHGEGTLVNALLAHCGADLSGIGGVARPGIVHRLDRDTSGLLVVAKTDAAHRSLSAQFADHGRTGALARAYLALVWGELVPASGTIEAALGRDPRHRDRMAVVSPERGRRAVTRYQMQQSYPDGSGEALASRLRCELETGRTHQIRVHLAHVGHPVLADPVYGSGFRTKAARLAANAREALEAMPGQALHAALLQFSHPLTGAILRFESSPPESFTRLETALTAR